MNKLRYILCGLLFVAAGLLLASCDKMEDNYMKFAKDGEIIYTGKADSVKAFPGNYKVKLSWLLLADPKITECRIFWNDGADSAVVPVQRTEGVDEISVTLDSLHNGLKERTYTFEIVSYDKDGHSSIPVSVTSKVYGDKYTSELYNRVVDKAELKGTSALINWYGAADQVDFIEIKYTNSQNEEVIHKETRKLNPGSGQVEFAAQTELPDYEKGTTVHYRTAYKPVPNAIDTFYTDYTEINIPVNIALNKPVERSSSSSGPNVNDGDISTAWQPSSSDRPDQNVWISIDLGSPKAFNEVTMHVTKRPEHISAYEILYSNDNSSWETAYASSSPPKEEEIIQFAQVTARYVKLNITLLETNSNINIGELEVWKKEGLVIPNQPAKIKIACVGNSITFGSFLASPATESYPAQLQALLGTAKYTVSNFGKSGATLLTKGDRPYINQTEYSNAIASKPDVVLIMLGTNDSKIINRGFIASDFKNDYKALIQNFENLSPKPRIILIPPAPGFDMTDGTYGGINETIIRGQIAPLVQAAATEKGLSIIDVYTPLKDHPEMFPDKVHPNKDGAAILADAVRDFLVTVLPK